MSAASQAALYSWYCSGREAQVDEQVLAELRLLGWELLEADGSVFD